MADVTWRSVDSGTTAWSYAFTPDPTDTTYTIAARASDNAGNGQTEGYGTITVYGDVSNPDSAITTPADGSTVNSISAISGTATDTRSGVASVDISIKDNGTNKYWNGSDWVDGEQSLATTYNAGAWTKNSGLPTWADGTSYTVKSLATDAVGNSEDAAATSTFTYDTTAPTFTIQYYSDVDLTSTLGDNPKLKAGTYYLKITSSETLTGNPTISIDAEGDANDVEDAATVSVAGNVYKYTRTISSDVLAVGSVLENISISGTDVGGNASFDVNPTDEASEAAYTDTTDPTLAEVTPVTNPTNDTTPNYTFSSTEAGTITYGGSCASATGSAVVGNNTIAFNELGEGTYDDCTIYVTDAAGNDSEILSVSEFEVDTTAPAVNITAPIAGTKVNAADVVTFTDGEPTSPQCSINDSDWVACTSGVTTLGDITGFNGLGQGNFTLYLKDTDAAGNPGTDSEVNVVKDTENPTFSAITPSQTYAKSGDTITVTFTASETLGGDPTVTLGGRAMSKTDQSGLDYTYSLTLNGTETEGTATISISGTDVAGNTGTDTTASITTDFTDPASVSITSPADSTYQKGTFTISASASDNEGGSGLSRVEFYEGANKLGEDAEAPYTYDWATDAEDDGAHALTAVAIDNAGNSKTSSTVNITVDNSAPTATAITDPTAGQTKKGTFTITATASDAIGIQKVEFYDGDPGDGGTLLGTDTTSTYTYDWATDAGDDGAHTLYSKAYDNSNNTLVSAGVAITVDNTTPTAPTYNSSEASTVWYKENPTLDIDFADNIKINTVEYKVNSDGTYQTIATGVDAANYNDNWSITADDWTAMAEGTNYLHFRVTDYAGNQHTTADDEAGFRFKKDVTAPTAPTYTTAENQWFASNPTLDINFSDAKAIETIKYQVDGTGGSWTTLADDLTGLTYTTDWSMSADIWNGLGEGTHYLYFQVTDDAGNVYTTADDAAGFTFKKDTAAPDAIAGMVISHTEDAWSNDDTIEFNWNDSTDAGSRLAGYSYEMDHTSDTTPDGVAEGSTSAYTTGSLDDDDDWYFHVKAIDNVGNVTAVVHYGPFKIDTTDPEIDHTAIEEAYTGDSIQISADVTDGGSGVDTVLLHWKQEGGSWNEETMNKSGDTYTKTIPAQYNPNIDIEYYVEAIDNVDLDAFDGTSGSPHVIDIIAEVAQFSINTDTTQTNGEPFAATITAKDEYNNDASFTGTAVISVDAYDGSWIDLDEDSYVITVGSTETDNVVFNNQVSRSIIVTLTGAGTTNYSTIRIHAQKSDDAGVFGNSADISITGFDATAVAGVTTANGEGNVGGANAEGQGLVPTGESQTPPWVPYAEGIAILMLVGSGAWWWVRMGGSGAGSGGIKNMMFYSLKTAASKLRMFFW